MTSVSYFSQNLEPFMSREPKMRVFKKACPSGASIGWDVYPQYKHNFRFLAQTTIYICLNGVQGIQQQPCYPQKIPRIHPLGVLYEINYHPWCWNNPQFYHIWLSWGTNVTRSFFTRSYGLPSFVFIRFWWDLPSLEKIDKIKSNVPRVCPSGDMFILNISSFLDFKPKQL